MGELEALTALRSYKNPRSGIAERFVDLALGGAASLGVLSTPLGDHQPTGWVICHSFGPEQVNLQPMEVAFARRLAAAGFSVLRYHAQGYGDSERSMESITLRSHLVDAIDAVAWFRGETGLSRVGLVGGRFGGTVAAMTAATLEAAALLLWDPVVKGDRYLRGLLRLGMAVEMAGEGRPRERARDPESLIDSGGVQVLGFPLTRALYDDVLKLDLLTEIAGFRGDSLVLQVSAAPEVSPELSRLAEHIVRSGGHCSLQVVIDAEARTFGQDRYRTMSDGGKADAQSGLSATLLAKSAAWCRSVGCADRAGAEDVR